jgi:hypothetical protein
MLRTTKPGEDMVDFNPNNIPPEHLDVRTHMVLHALLDERDKDRLAPTRSSIAAAANLDPDCSLDQEYSKLLKVHAQLDSEYAQLGTGRNDTNRTMYHAFANGLFPIHENNFALYCKPHLRNLPPNTAVDLQKARDDLKPDDLPPYRPIQMDVLPEPTVPTFKTTLTQANKPTTLLPRAQWMKDTPPFMTDYEADTAYSAACAWMFGTEDPKHFPPQTNSPTVHQSAFSPTA